MEEYHRLSESLRCGLHTASITHSRPRKSVAMERTTTRPAEREEPAARAFPPLEPWPTHVSQIIHPDDIHTREAKLRARFPPVTSETHRVGRVREKERGRSIRYAIVRDPWRRRRSRSAPCFRYRLDRVNFVSSRGETSVVLLLLVVVSSRGFRRA